MTAKAVNKQFVEINGNLMGGGKGNGGIRERGKGAMNTLPIKGGM